MAALNLAFYLASWGMYRGSSFLLSHDYKIHIPLIKNIILNDKYSDLWDFDKGLKHSDSNLFKNNINLLFDNGLISDIKASYGGKPTPTLITKIIMGTFGCVPAYDRYFIQGLKRLNTEVEEDFIYTLNEKSLMGLIDFYISNYNEFNISIERLPQSDIKYPAMKLIDMYFWQLGYSV